MKTLWIAIVMTLMPWLIALSVLAQSDGLPIDSTSDDLASAGYVQFHHRLDIEEWTNHRRVLGMTTEQERAIEPLLASLFAQYEELDSTKGAALWEHGSRVAAIVRDNIYTPEHAIVMKNHFRDVKSFNESESAIESAFFDAVNAVLNEDQQKRLVQVRLARERLRYPPHGATVPGSHLDMIALLDELEVDRSRCIHYIESYNTELAVLRKKRYDEDIHRRVTDAEILSSHAMQMSQSALDSRAVMLRRLVRIDKRLRAVNVMFLENLRTCLDESQSILIRDASRRLMYPSLFPHERADSVRQKAEEFRNSYPDESDEYASVNERIRGFEHRYEATVKLLIEHIVADREQFSSTLYAFADDRAEQRMLFEELLTRRDQVCHDFSQEIDAAVLEWRGKTPGDR